MPANATPESVLRLFASYPSMKMCLVERHFESESGQRQGQVQSVVFRLQGDGKLLEDGQDWELYSISLAGRETLRKLEEEASREKPRTQRGLFG